MKLQELARDFVALGGIPFVSLVVARIAILQDWIYLSKISLAVALFVSIAIFAKFNLHSGLAIIILIFLSIHYAHLPFTIFASLIYVLMLVSLVYLGENRWKVFLGATLGVVVSLVSWIVINLYV
ncbi:MAG: hypothetical protein ABIF18_01160 [archaeon]